MGLSPLEGSDSRMKSVLGRDNLQYTTVGGKMDTLITVNIIGYAAVLAGGLVLGTLFGRSVMADLTGAMHALDSRLVVLETTFQANGSAAKASHDPATAAIRSHAEATTKLAAAIETHAAAQALAGPNSTNKS